jgi:beta-galactosidase
MTRGEPMILGTQYYRPPFPEPRYWHDDLAAMVDAGLGAVQLWACWGWIEPEPGQYRFEDYDNLVSIADSVGLRVVISTIAEIQPFWIHRCVPGSEMVDNFGRAVRSSLRQECNVGLTPGGCFDHPEVQERLGAFLDRTARQYGASPALLAWDCWNETRWAVQADGYVCYCRHTLGAFREWLRQRYGDLEGLCAAWHRRYSSWDDVVPGKSPGQPYTDLVEFEAFITWRSARHAAFRAGRLRAADGAHPVLAHCGKPAVFSGGSEYEQALSRGNDFDLAEVLDGFGCSHFPAWENYSLTELGSRIEEICSAAGSKPAWVSELQGGGARAGFGSWPAVDAAAQQRWVWSAYGRGAKAVLFWCWRDEVFGRESSGFGLTGSDGQSAARLERMAQTGRALKENATLLEGYAPDAPEVGVLFSQGSYQLDWAQNGNLATQASGSLLGWLSVLERAQLPYRVVDAGRPVALDGLRLIVLPWPLVVPGPMGAALAEWVSAGGTLITEAELDAFDELGFYRYPEGRPLACALGLTSCGRRLVGEGTSMHVSLGPRSFELPVAGWLEALGTEAAEVLATSPAGEAVSVRRGLGRGSVVALGSFPGLGYRQKRQPEVEAFVRELAGKVGALPPLAVQPGDGELVQWRLGRSGPDRVLFITAEPPVTAVSVRMAKDVVGRAAPARVVVGRGAGPVRTTGAGTEVDILLSPDGVGVVAWA